MPLPEGSAHRCCPGCSRARNGTWPRRPDNGHLAAGAGPRSATGRWIPVAARVRVMSAAMNSWHRGAAAVSADLQASCSDYAGPGHFRIGRWSPWKLQPRMPRAESLEYGSGTLFPLWEDAQFHRIADPATHWRNCRGSRRALSPRKIRSAELSPAIADRLSLQFKEVAMLVNCAAYQEGKKLADIAREDIHFYLDRPECFVWVALRDPEAEELAVLQRQFGLHEL